MAKSRYLITEISKRYFGRRAAWALPETWVGLFTAIPTNPDDAGAELGASGYARVRVSNDDAGWELPEMGDWLRRNRQALYFGPARADWNVSGFGVWDASSGGQLLHYGPLTSQMVVRSGRGLQITAGALVLAALYDTPGAMNGLEYAIGGWTSEPPGRWWVETLTSLNASTVALPTPPDAAYSGIRYDNTATAWPLVDGAITNAAALVFEPASVDWPDIVGLAFLDINTKDLWWVAPLTAAATVRQGERLEIPAGSIAFTEL